MNTQILFRILDRFVDNYIDCFGINSAIAFLVDAGVSRRELISVFSFDKKSIEKYEEEEGEGIE